MNINMEIMSIFAVEKECLDGNIL